jgi:hypothetical protein
MSRNDDILERKLFSFTEVDHATIRVTSQGTLILGSPDSGKSSTVGRQYAKAFLSVPTMGGLVMVAKAEESENWITYAKECGREKDLIIFNAQSGHCFDPMHYEWTRPGRGAGDLESILDFFTSLTTISKKEVGHGHDPFWENGATALERNVIRLIDLAGDPVSITNIDRAIKSLPTTPEEQEMESWQKSSYAAGLIKTIKDNKDTLTEEQWQDLDAIAEFAFDRWPALDPRPRSSLEMTWSGLADKFRFHPLNRLFCSGKCTFTPEDTTHRNKIVICDFPLLEYGKETGRTINIILKLIFQRAWLRRKLSESPNPVFLYQDEFQYFIAPRFDNFFQQTCRGSRVSVVCLTQNILNLSEELGEPQPGSKTKSFCGNLGTKIALQQNEPDTSTFMADIIGKEFRYIENYNAGGGTNSQMHAGVGAHRQLVHIIEPVEFTRLLKPDGQNPCAEAIVYSGKPFNASKTREHPKGRNFIRVFFSREA